MQILRSRPPVPAAQLVSALGVSRATLMRAVRVAGPEVLTIGRARRTCYAARRRLRGSAQPLPVFQIDERGASAQVGRLHLAYPDGCALEFTAPSLWPLDEAMRDGWFDGLPYFLQDLRPAGFLGRRFARAHARLLQVGHDPSQWSDDDALHAISLLGADLSGNFIVGEEALRLWLDHRQQPPAWVQDAHVLQAYAASAARAMLDGDAGSSAAGEFPKFIAMRNVQGEATHVLVKFSGSDDSPGTRRWSDLLVCEHLAAQAVATIAGLSAAQASIVQGKGRTFLEVIRFDRHGSWGRSPLCSWAALNYGWFGLAGRPWTEAAATLLQRRLVDRDGAHAICRLWHFGQLIANTDMHDGNLSFIPRRSATGPALVPAPAYDMLPMLYAPQRGVELAPVRFTPRLPLPAEREDWHIAAAAAGRFWSSAADDVRISPAFRAVCGENLRALRQAAATLGVPREG